VLQQNANQVARGSCAPTATLSALSGNAAVHALRKATELFWTGRIMTTFEGKPFELKPCEYVYDQVPGMVPLDKHDRPYQAVGLEWYWTATLGQAVELLAGNRCEDIKETTYALSGPWGYGPSHSLPTQSKNEVAQLNDGASTEDSLRYCKLIFNDGECNDDEFCCKKSYNLRADSLAEREKNLDQACSIVMKGGFVTVSVKADPFLQARPKKEKNMASIHEAAKYAGATGHCEVPPLAPWDKAQSRGRVLGSPYAALGEVPSSHDHRIALSACVQAEGDSNATTYVFTTWGTKIRISKAFAIGTDDGYRFAGVLAEFSGATRLAAQPKGQKNNPPAIARCKSISSRRCSCKSKPQEIQGIIYPKDVCQIGIINSWEEWLGLCGKCTSCA